MSGNVDVATKLFRLEAYDAVVGDDILDDENARPQG
jgi:hypothetical protein